jgi:hypothetical protein
MLARFRDPVDGVEVCVEVSTMAEVLATVDRAVARYQAALPGLLPGASLWRTADDPGDSLSLVVAPDA